MAVSILGDLVVSFADATMCSVSRGFARGFDRDNALPDRSIEQSRHPPSRPVDPRTLVVMLRPFAAI